MDIVAGIYWLESDQVDSWDELSKKFIEDKGSMGFNNKTNNFEDTRTYAWYALPLEDFVGPIIEKRKIARTQPSPENQALQISLKNVINTLYGVICSRFFSINNVVVAENITSKCRADMWLMAKPLNTYLSITDGGPFSFNSGYPRL